MIYKYLFYSASYFIKKYDKLWNVGDIYYIFGAGWIGLTLSATLIDIIDIIGLICFYDDIGLYLENLRAIYVYSSIYFVIPSVFYFKYKNRHVKIYNEIKKLDGKRKKTYKVLNVVHIIIVYGLMFFLSTIVRGGNVSNWELFC